MRAWICPFPSASGYWGIVLLILTPGVAISALLALVVLALCIVSVVFERRRSRRR